ncbi:MAG: penicillin-binding transpeptidase domain-containing protein [Akkermansia sp.]|nr:penicillin-binding transpeptidase domain-containing protein [Akkermansia sp.]
MKTKVPFAGRCLILCVIILGLSGAIACTLVDLQVNNDDKIKGIVAEELIQEERIPAERGIIMDRNEEILTNNVQSVELIADRYHLRDITAVVYGLAYNQISNTEEWRNEKDPAKRRRMFANERARLLGLAKRKLTREQRAKLRKELNPKDARANRLFDYDPEKCEALYQAHDRLVAEIIHPFIRDIEIKETVEVEPEKSITRGGKKITIPAKTEERTRYITKQEIIDMIAQPDVAEFNKTAEARGEKKRRYTQQIQLAHGLTVETAEQIKEAVQKAHLHGVVTQSELSRSYIMPEMLSHVVGYVDSEQKGVGGVEGIYNSYLAGTDGLREYRYNARGQVLPNEDDRYLQPKHGLNLRLTIDMRLQTICEQELDKGMKHYRARRGCMIVVDPKTGDILAMVSRPAINLTTKDLITHEGEFKRGTIKDDKGAPITGDFNFACQARYEPGSTFKVVAVTAAVDRGVMGINSPVSASPFSVGGGSKAINDGRFNYGVLTVGQMLKKSSNPAAARIALACKWPLYKEYVERYGLTKSAGIDLPSGGSCLLANGNHIVNFSRIAYGYSVSVSPLHMAMVYATIANDGVRMKPRLIDRIIAADGSVYNECKPQEVCRVMSPATAKAIRGALETVTHKSGPAGRGTATQAAIPGFRIGGKTGTAKKVSSSGKYFDNLYVVSFAGVLPIDDPRLVVMTVIDEPHPRDCNAGGGTVAAPIFRAAAERFIKVLHLQPSDPAEYEKYLSEKEQAQAAANPQ